jgi:hypothetical protein
MMNEKKQTQVLKYQISKWLLLLSIMLNGTVLAESKPLSDCQQLAHLKIDNHISDSYTTRVSTKLIASSNDLPEYCQILGYISPAINFEIRLPIRNWNGKFYMTGCDGFCGKVDADKPNFFNAMNYGLKRHYAVSTMDSGHWGNSPIDARWAYNNRQAEIDWGYRAVHETAIVTKITDHSLLSRKTKTRLFPRLFNWWTHGHDGRLTLS